MEQADLAVQTRRRPWSPTLGKSPKRNISVMHTQWHTNTTPFNLQIGTANILNAIVDEIQASGLVKVLAKEIARTTHMAEDGVALEEKPRIKR